MGQGRESKDRGAARVQGRASGRSSFPGAAVGLAALLGLIAGTARGETLSLNYLVGWGHLTIGEAAVSYRQTESRYRLVGDGRTRGILDLFVTWTGRAETEGVLREDGRRPLVHRHRGTWKREIRARRGSTGPAPRRRAPRPNRRRTWRR